MAYGQYEGSENTPSIRKGEQLNYSVIERKRQEILSLLEKENEIYIWGASGKGVLFLNSLPPHILAKVSFAIDINVSKQGKYLPKSGIEIIAPENVQSNDQIVLIMNHAYKMEIEKLIIDLGIACRIYTTT